MYEHSQKTHEKLMTPRPHIFELVTDEAALIGAFTAAFSYHLLAIISTPTVTFPIFLSALITVTPNMIAVNDIDI